jgi:hypothetical protein
VKTDELGRYVSPAPMAVSELEQIAYSFQEQVRELGISIGSLEWSAATLGHPYHRTVIFVDRHRDPR